MGAQISPDELERIFEEEELDRLEALQLSGALQLSERAIECIFHGEKYDKPQLQLLGYQKVPGVNGRYRTHISDGIHTTPLAIFGLELLDRLHNGEFEPYTIVILEKYRCLEMQPGKKVLVLLELRLVVKGRDVGGKLGDPQTFYWKEEDVANSYKNYQPADRLEALRLTGALQLSEGALQCIFDGEMYFKPQLQLLGYKRVPGETSERYRFLVSDGIIMNSFVMLDTQLNERLHNGEFEPYAIVKLDKYSCPEVQPGKKVLIIIEVTVVATSQFVGGKLGDPQKFDFEVESSENYQHNDQTSVNSAMISVLNSVTEPEEIICEHWHQYGLAELCGQCFSLKLNCMGVQLNVGALQRIFNGEICERPQLQLLGYKLVPGGQERYRFLVSDGILCHPFAMLGTQLNNRLNNGEFERYTVITLGKYSCTEMQPGKKILIMLELSLVANSRAVNRKIGNPQQLTSGSESVTNTHQHHQPPVNVMVINEYGCEHSSQFGHLELCSPCFSLKLNSMGIYIRGGSIRRILAGEICDRPQLQLLGYKRVPGGQNRYRFLVSDGVLCHPFAMLGTQLNDRLNNGEFERYAVVELDKYSCTEMQPGKKIIILLELTLVAMGEAVKRKIGNPQPTVILS